jgi:heme/copper-type cytochrome/quinol oxidase subunit 2
MEMPLMMPLMMLLMFFAWLTGIVFLVATVLAVYYYIAGKEEEFQRAKKVALGLLVVVAALAVLSFLFMIPVRFM